MIDFDALVLGPAYQVFGTQADVELAGTDGRVETLTVQDHTRGVSVGFNGSKAHVLDASAPDFALATVRPAAAVQLTELTAKELAPAELQDAAITFNGRAWRIKTHAAAPGPNGTQTGEIFLILEAGP